MIMPFGVSDKTTVPPSWNYYEKK